MLHFKPRLTGLVLATALAVTAIPIFSQPATAEPPATTTALVAEVENVVEAILQYHLDPPTRQELVLQVLRGAARRAQIPLPGDMSVKISNAVSAPSLYKLLADELGKLLNDENLAAYKIEEVASEIGGIVQGGIEVVVERDHLVNEQLAANRYVGIGVTTSISPQENRLQFASVMQGGAAALQGVKAGDVVETVDGKDTLGVPMGEVIQWLRGPEDSVVKLRIRTGTHARELEIVRSVVKIDTLTVAAQSEDAQAALVRVNSISASSLHELRQRIEDFPESMTTLILDLRLTPNGNLHHLHLLADALLEEADVGEVERRTGRQRLKTESGSILNGLKLVIVCVPGLTHQMDWLATIAEDNGALVFRDEAPASQLEIPRQLIQDPMPVPMMREFVQLPVGNRFLGVAAARLLAADGKPFAPYQGKLHRAAASREENALPGNALPEDANAAEWHRVSGNDAALIKYILAQTHEN